MVIAEFVSKMRLLGSRVSLKLRKVLMTHLVYGATSKKWETVGDIKCRMCGCHFGYLEYRGRYYLKEYFVNTNNTETLPSQSQRKCKYIFISLEKSGSCCPPWFSPASCDQACAATLRRSRERRIEFKYRYYTVLKRVILVSWLWVTRGCLGPLLVLHDLMLRVKAGYLSPSLSPDRKQRSK